MKALKIVTTQAPSDASFVTPDGYLVEYNGAHGDNAHLILGHTSGFHDIKSEHYKNDLDRVMREYGLIRVRPEKYGSKTELNIEARSNPTDEQLDALRSYYPDSEVIIDTEYDKDADSTDYNRAILRALRAST